MNWKKEYKPLLIILGIFLLFFFLPAGSTRFDNAVAEALHLAKWYAREHVILCLIPAFFIAGAVIGLSMHFIFRKGEKVKIQAQMYMPQQEEARP